MSARSWVDPGVVDASVGSTLRYSIHPRRRRNLLVPLLRLPTELILKIFVHVIESEGDDDYWVDYDNDDHHHLGPSSLVLTAICHELREIGIASHQLWSSVDFTILPIAELFLERCEYNPRILLAKDSKPRQPGGVSNPRREVVWEKLEGRTFNNLRSLVFQGTQDEFAHRVVGVLQRAPNVSNLDICNSSFCPREELPWLGSGPIPNLSTLHLCRFWISWTSPLLQNLTQLSLDFGHSSLPSERASIEMLLTALANCPDLEILNLAHAGPHPLNGHQDECDVVVQLGRLRELSLEFYDLSMIVSVLSHIKYPEATGLTVYIFVDEDTELSEIIPQVLPHRNAQTIQHFRKSTTLTICLGPGPQFSTDNLLIHFLEPHIRMGPQRNPQEWTQFVSKIVEAVGGDTVVSLNIESLEIDLPEGMWEALLHGLPRLERIYCELTGWGEGGDPVNSFILVFSRSFEGGLVCPQLQHLELPKEMLSQDSSVAILKHALVKRDACGRRLKGIGLSGDAVEMDDMLVLEPFRDLVDKVQ